MKKLFVILISVLLLTGCSFKEQIHEVDTIYYNLDISNYYKENIVFTFPKNAYETAMNSINFDYDSLEYILLIDNFSRPIHNNLYTLYGKNIYQMKQAIEVDLDFDYLEKDFVNSNYMNTCFEKHSIKDEDDYLEIELGGEFYCLQDKTMVLNVSTDYQNVYANGTPVDNAFQWVIDPSNVSDVNIYYKVYRDKKDMATSYGVLQKHMDTNQLEILEFIIIVIVLIVGFVFYKFLYHREFREFEK